MCANIQYYIILYAVIMYLATLCLNFEEHRSAGISVSIIIIHNPTSHQLGVKVQIGSIFMLDHTTFELELNGGTSPIILLRTKVSIKCQFKTLGRVKAYSPTVHPSLSRCLQHTNTYAYTHTHARSMTTERLVILPVYATKHLASCASLDLCHVGKELAPKRMECADCMEM